MRLPLALALDRTQNGVELLGSAVAGTLAQVLLNDLVPEVEFDNFFALLFLLALLLVSSSRGILLLLLQSLLDEDLRDFLCEHNQSVQIGLF